jgi:hypothetical protein
MLKSFLEIEVDNKGHTIPPEKGDNIKLFKSGEVPDNSGKPVLIKEKVICSDEKSMKR